MLSGMTPGQPADCLRRRSLVRIGLAAAGLFGVFPVARAGDAPLRVLAPVSLREALDAALALPGSPRATVVYGGTPALVRQVQQGLAADAIITADEDWMDRLQAQGRLVQGSRHVLARNRLALIAPAASRLPDVSDPAAFSTALRETLVKGRMAVADLQTVPAGRYALAALKRAGWETLVQGRLAPTDNVRAALRLVSRGEAVLGLVYLTDALSDPGVRVLHVFASDFHPDIRLPVAALVAGRTEASQHLIRWLGSDLAQAEFVRRGFVRP